MAAAAGAVVVRLPINLGVGGAMSCGFRYAVDHHYARVVQCDADGQHHPEAITDLLAHQRQSGAHLVIGSRFHPDAEGYSVGAARRLAMWLLRRSATRAAGRPIHDATSGFRVFAEPLLSAFASSFPTHYLGDTYEAVVTAGRAGYVIDEVPVTMSQRTHGMSSASPLAAGAAHSTRVVVVAAGLHFAIPRFDQTLGARDS